MRRLLGRLQGASDERLWSWAASAARPMRRARRVHPCCNRAEFTPAFEAGCSTAASRRCMSCVVRDTGRCPLRASLLIKGRMVRTVPRSRGSGLAALIADFCNKICQLRTCAGAATTLLDDLVRNGDQPWWEGEPERLGDFEVDQ